jgi:hypothetical protein
MSPSCSSSGANLTFLGKLEAELSCRQIGAVLKNGQKTTLSLKLLHSKHCVHFFFLSSENKNKVSKS